jgi:hypothetical protein
MEADVAELLSDLFSEMKSDHEAHLRRLEIWRDAGGKLDDFPGHETINDFIEREVTAINSLSLSIDLLKQKGL